ncbi:MAG: decaprenyl-phosphate phosphoribosyltransferase [Fimbriimonadaceae bacterium]|nr:decaprenyl-phosphate phosphoribosyltransferase [Fimbriimonadaceae bacterium]QYK57007.1 MAG: decaprenyl-phosphate phosphoribosyltransferase [Fimbriimonadaceae bacterium]
MPYLQLLRPKQWSKNLLIFGALIFSGKAGDPDSLIRALIAFVAMCLASSGVYVWNDILDVESDRVHPKKRLRPIASGKVPVSVAAVLAVVLVLGAAALGFYLNKTSLALIVAYLVIQLIYNLRGKSVAVLDVFFISTGFVLRAVLGAAAIPVTISSWLLFCTGALALMLGFAKRRNEFIAMGDQRAASRASLADYSLKALDGLVTFFAAAAALCYGIYTIESRTAHRYPALLLTAPFVFYAVTRYLWIVLKQDEGGEPADILFGDPHIWGSIVLFVAAALTALSGARLPFLEN